MRSGLWYQRPDPAMPARCSSRAIPHPRSAKCASGIRQLRHEWRLPWSCQSRRSEASREYFNNRNQVCHLFIYTYGYYCCTAYLLHLGIENAIHFTEIAVCWIQSNIIRDVTTIVVIQRRHKMRSLVLQVLCLHASLQRLPSVSARPWRRYSSSPPNHGEIFSLPTCVEGGMNRPHYRNSGRIARL